MITYSTFSSILHEQIVKYDEDFIYDLIVTVVKNPTRYTGVFRITNAKTKLIQNVTQSQEIKFGDFMERIVTDYISIMGYDNLDKSIGVDEQGNQLNADQVFSSGKTIYLIEQKIRDDHDSTKKRGQYQNFQKKINCLKKNCPNSKIIAAMWFIDETLVKNKRFYEQQACLESIENTEIYIKYGKDLFIDIFDRYDVWNEIYDYLSRNKLERSQEVLSIPDFDSSESVRLAIQRMKMNEPLLYNKLMSSDYKYINLRKELFPSGKTLK